MNVSTTKIIKCTHFTLAMFIILDSGMDMYHIFVESYRPIFSAIKNWYRIMANLRIAVTLYKTLDTTHKTRP